MNIKVQSEKEIYIYGNIKSVVDYQDVKKVISEILLSGNKELTIHLMDSFSITSSVIGMFLKMVYQDSVKLTLKVADTRLVSLLDDLKLTEAFNVNNKVSD